MTNKEFIVDELTGELIEKEDNNALVEKELIEQGVITDEYVEKLFEIEALKEQTEIYLFQQREKIKEIFKKYGVKSCKTDQITITYVPEHMTRKTDTERLKADGLYDKYSKFSAVKESIRIQKKGKND